MPADDFDPYFKWLGIPVQDQPADHYRLLGIPRFTDDRDVIGHAADQRMMLLKSVQTGQYGGLSQQILRQLAKAKRCLLTSQEKVEYDAMLRQEVTATSRPQVAPPPPPPSASSAPPPTSVVLAPPAALSDSTRMQRPAPAESHLESESKHVEPTLGQEIAAADSSSASSFFNKALKAGREIKAKALTAARRATFLAERKKLESMDLPRAYTDLGRDVLALGRFREEFPELHQQAHNLAAQWRAAGQHDDPHSLSEFAATAAERIKDVVSTPGILSKLNAAYAELGMAAFMQFGEGSGPPHLLTRIVNSRSRLAELERELGQDS